MASNRQGILTAIAARRWAMEEQALRSAAELLVNANLAEIESARREYEAAQDTLEPLSEDADRDGYYVVDRVAVIEVVGPLSKQVPYCAGILLPEMTSTLALKRALAAALDDAAADSILLLVDSPGGEVAGTQEMGDAIYEARARKPVHAHISDLGASGAYWLASQAETLSANATALVGSIGVYCVLDDWSEHFAKEGVKVHLVRSGPYKGTGVPGASVTDEELQPVQEEVNDLASLFADAIARGRGMSRDAVNALATGRVWVAARALELGLIDHVENGEDALERVAHGHTGTPGPLATQAESQTGDAIMSLLNRSKSRAEEAPEAPPAEPTETGGIMVTLSPQAAIDAGAQFAVDGGEMQDSGATVDGLAVGDHTVTYAAVKGWNAPDEETAAVVANATTELAREYSEAAVEDPPAETPPEAMTPQQAIALAGVIGSDRALAAHKAGKSVEAALTERVRELGAKIAEKDAVIKADELLGSGTPVPVQAADAKAANARAAALARKGLDPNTAKFAGSLKFKKD